MREPLAEGNFTILRKPEKGGWHYVLLPGIPISAKQAGGLIRVSGLVDDYAIKQFNLLPTKTADMMLVLKAPLRKAIQKKAGDTVQVQLFADDSPVEIPEDILDSLLQSEKAYQFFQSLSDSNKKYYIDWVNEAKQLDTKVTRILKMIEQLENKRRFWDWPAAH